MSIVNGVVKAPVGLYEIIQLLGESSIDVGTACLSDKINIFAKWKPQDVNKARKYEQLTDSERQTSNYGLTPKRVYSWQELMSAYDGNRNGWVYNKPKDYCRLTDFLNEKGTSGYWHKAPSMLQGVYMEEDVLFIEDNNYFQLVYETTSSEPDSVTMDSLFSGYRFGLYFIDNLNYTKLARTCNTNDKNVIISADTIPDEAGDTFTMYPFITNAEYSGRGTGTAFMENAIHYTVPGISPLSVNIKSFGDIFGISGVLNRPKSTLTITIANNYNKTVFVREAYFQVLLATNESGVVTDASAGEFSGDLGDINESNLVAGTTYTFTSTSPSLSKYLQNPILFRVWVFLDIQNYPKVYKAIPIQIINS